MRGRCWRWWEGLTKARHAFWLSDLRVFGLLIAACNFLLEYNWESIDEADEDSGRGGMRGRTVAYYAKHVILTLLSTGIFVSVLQIAAVFSALKGRLISCRPSQRAPLSFPLK
jgi:hypothetical protein